MIADTPLKKTSKNHSYAVKHKMKQNEGNQMINEYLKFTLLFWVGKQ